MEIFKSAEDFLVKWDELKEQYFREFRAKLGIEIPQEVDDIALKIFTDYELDDINWVLETQPEEIEAHYFNKCLFARYFIMSIYELDMDGEMPPESMVALQEKFVNYIDNSGTIPDYELPIDLGDGEDNTLDVGKFCREELS